MDDIIFNTILLFISLSVFVVCYDKVDKRNKNKKSNTMYEDDSYYPNYSDLVHTIITFILYGDNKIDYTSSDTVRIPEEFMNLRYVTPKIKEYEIKPVMIKYLDRDIYDDYILISFDGNGGKSNINLETNTLLFIINEIREYNGSYIKKD